MLDGVSQWPHIYPLIVNKIRQEIYNCCLSTNKTPLFNFRFSTCSMSSVISYWCVYNIERTETIEAMLSFQSRSRLFCIDLCSLFAMFTG